MPRNVTLVFVLVLLASQMPALAAGGRAAILRQATPMPTWERVDTGPFSAALPPGWQYVPQHGVDSFVGEFVGPDMQLGFDYGNYWRQEPEPGAPGYEVLHEDVDSRPADIWVARADPANETLLHVDDINDPEPPGLFPTRMSLVGDRLTPEHQDVALAVMRSLRFKRVIPEQGRWEVVAELANTNLLDLDLLDDGALRVTGGYYGADGGQPVGVVYDLRDGVWRRKSITDTILVGGLSGDWAVEYGGKRILHLDADGTWNIALSDSPATLFDLQDGLLQGPWAVGIRALLHFDGAHWSSVPDYTGGLSIDLVTEDEGWTAGGRSLYRRTGGAWLAVPWPSLPADGSVVAVDTLSLHEAWFAGGQDTGAGGLLHWHDGDWNYVGDLTPHNLWAVDLVSPAEGWAVGGGISGQGPCEVLRYRDGTWQPQTDVCTGLLHAVKVAADGTTWAVGYRESADGVRTGLVLRYSAPAVTPTATPAPTATVTPAPPSLYLPVASKGS